MECFLMDVTLETYTSPNQTKKPNNLNMIWKVFSPSNLCMTSLRIPFQCAKVFIGQAYWIIGQPGLTIEYSSKYIS